MVVVGRACGVCGDPVASRKEGRACAACGLQFHKRCLTDQKRCSKCGTDLKRAASQARAVREHEATDTIENGRRLLWAATILGLGAQVLVNILLIAYGDDDQVFRSVWRVSLSILAFVSMHQGSVGAARLVVALFGLGGVASLGSAFLLDGSSGFAAELTGAMGLAFLSTALVLGFSKDFWRYLVHLRAEREGPHS